jgi:hypothetical protein
MGIVSIDQRDPTPICAQTRSRVARGDRYQPLTSGDQLPTVRQLALDFQINSNTVARVYQIGGWPRYSMMGGRHTSDVKFQKAAS